MNDDSGVGAGGGHAIYINGKQLLEEKTCNGRGSGGQPKGAFITREFLDDFKADELTIAIKTFLRFNDKYSTKPKERIPQGKISIHLEVQQLPPMGDELVRRSAALVPMLSSEWQAKQDPDNHELRPDDHKFRWDGQFAVNPKVLGSWNVIAEVPEIAEFDPKQKNARARKPPFSAITFKDGGTTGDPTWVWSGDILMDLNTYEALQMKSKAVDEQEYLFIESGRFSTRNKPGWKPNWYILERK